MERVVAGSVAGVDLAEVLKFREADSELGEDLIGKGAGRFRRRREAGW